MTVLQRAATIAAMTFSLAGLLGHSTPGLATGLDRSAIPTPLLASFNTPSDQIVPTAAAQSTPAVTADDIANAGANAEDASYSTLADAVAAQDVVESNDDALHCLAGAVYFESRGEPLSGQLAVAEVIVNRAESGRYPTDVCDVITQRGQFGFVRGGRIPSIRMGDAYRTALAVAKVALANAWNSPAAKALYFNTADRVPAARLTRIASIGNHVFYR